MIGKVRNIWKLQKKASGLEDECAGEIPEKELATINKWRAEIKKDAMAILDDVLTAVLVGGAFVGMDYFENLAFEKGEVIDITMGVNLFVIGVFLLGRKIAQQRVIDSGDVEG